MMMMRDQLKKRRQRVIALTLLFSLAISLTFPVSVSADPHPLFGSSCLIAATNPLESSVVFPITGNVYPLGHYSVSLNIGRPPKLFDLDIDSGSDLTWVQCDAPCISCTKPRNQQYKPSNNLIRCSEPLCSAADFQKNSPCKTKDEQCDYEVEYADHGSSLGVLVKDVIPLKLTNGTLFTPRLGFGCGYDQRYSGPHDPPSTSGVLGLGKGKTSTLTQLSALGIIKNVVGHCLSGQGGGFLFFGDDLVPSSGTVWTKMLSDSAGSHYSSGPAEVYYGGKAVGIKGLTVVFDSGSSYTYFNSRVYKTILDLVKKDLNGKPLKGAPEDKSLPICWKGSKPFKSVNDVKQYFKPLALVFLKNVQIQLPPETYLIITKDGNACFGILNGTEVGLEHYNLIGDISLQDKMVIYDNEKQQIGWVAANCNRLTKS